MSMQKKKKGKEKKSKKKKRQQKTKENLQQLSNHSSNQKNGEIPRCSNCQISSKKDVKSTSKRGPQRQQTGRQKTKIKTFNHLLKPTTNKWCTTQMLKLQDLHKKHETHFKIFQFDVAETPISERHPHVRTKTRGEKFGKTNELFQIQGKRERDNTIPGDQIARSQQSLTQSVCK